MTASSTPDDRLAAIILDLLARRSPGATICPSEAARTAAGPGAAEGEWRALMEPARAAARDLASRGLVEVVQGGQVIDPSAPRGPIRIRLAEQ